MSHDLYFPIHVTFDWHETASLAPTSWVNLSPKPVPAAVAGSAREVLILTHPLGLFRPPPLCACHCEGLNRVTPLSGCSVHFFQYPMVLAIVRAATGYTPSAHRGY